MSDFTSRALVYSFLFLFGACLGSFLNVVIYRVPRKISVVFPRSACPQCNEPIPAYALIPIAGYFLARAKCTNCKKPISLRYPFVELLTGLLTVAIFSCYLLPEDLIYQIFARGEPPLGRFLYGEYLALVTALWLAYSGIALSAIDLEHRILPDRITLPGLVVGLVLGSLNPRLGPLGSITGVLVGGGSLLLVAKVYEWARNREGLGMGDVKYLACLGAVLGWKGVIYTIALSSVLGAIVGLAYIFVRKRDMQVALPFGPFIAVGALVTFLFFENISRFLQGG